MRAAALRIAYMRLLDAAPLIAAQEMGFAEAEGLTLELIAASSWSSVRDMLTFGRADAAHLLAPMPIAMALGLGGVQADLSALSVLSVNGNVIGVSRALETRLREIGHAFDFVDAARAAVALAAVAPEVLTIGVPFPFSTHVELLNHWRDATPLSATRLEIRTVPPPLMAQALASGEIDAFCVGEPWGSVSVEAGVGALLLPGKAIWSFAPEKVLTVRRDWASAEPQLRTQLMRAVWKAGRWLSHPESRTAAAELLARKEYLDVPAEVIDRALSGHLMISNSGEPRHVDGFIEFHHGAANFPWRSQAKWFGARLAARAGLDVAAASKTASAVFRTDLYRAALRDLGAELPGASEKVEGAIRHPTAVTSQTGRLILNPDAFFDGDIFDPSAL